jgi:signal transduction histidine kinase
LEKQKELNLALDTIKNIESALKERVKELECLYSISHELEVAENLEEALETCTVHLANGFQFPQICIACIQLDGRLFGDKTCCDDCDMPRLTHDILISGRLRGNIAVCYLEDAPFLEEEKKLLREISFTLSRTIERKETRENLERKRGLLVARNLELTHLTQDLTRSNNSLQAFLKAITDTIVVIDSRYNITQSNKESIGISGKCYQKIFQSDSVCENCPAQKAFKLAQPFLVEKNHNQQYFSLQAYPILDENEDHVDAVLEICKDITRDKQIEAELIQSSRLASLGKLVAGVAHEINNPNTFIKGNINIVNEAMTDIIPLLDKLYRENPDLQIARLDYDIFKESIPVLLEDMSHGSNRIQKIVEGLRNFARKDEGFLNDDIDINSLIKYNLRITEKEVRKHAHLHTTLDTTLPTFKGNVNKLEQVLMNLLLNAAQAIERKDGKIFITTSLDKTSKEIIISINDNGNGMDKETQKHIFDPFFTTKRHKGGTGLGLSIIYGIIQEHKGKIEVHSHPGKGTTFTIRIPTLSSPSNSNAGDTKENV